MDALLKAFYEHPRVLLLVFSSFLILTALLFKRATAPIAKLPGPLLTRFTVLPAVYQDYKSNRTNWTNALHARYGPLVRLSPSEVSASSPASIRDVFTGSAKAGYYDKAPLFNIFQHFGARNAFSSISSESHSWRRKVVAGNYAQTAIVAKEAKLGNIWTRVGRFQKLIKREGVPTAGQQSTEGSKSADVFSACRFYSADNISAHLFVEGSRALDGDARARRFIEASVELPDDVMTYLKIEYESVDGALQSFRRFLSRIVGLQSTKKTGRSRLAKASGKKISENEIGVKGSGWYGGTEIRDFGFQQFMASRRALEAGDISATTEDPVSARLAANVLAGESATGSDPSNGDDTGVRLCKFENEPFLEPTVFYRNEGCASECMDQLLAGLDTVGDSLSYALHLLSLSENAEMQKSLRQECRSMGLPRTGDKPLTQDKLAAIQAAPYLEAVLKETLRRYPASTTALQRVVPSGGRVLDNSFFVPGGVVIGASPVTTNMDVDVFDRSGRYNVAEWAPRRWLDAGEETLAEMNRRLWTFGSGGRGCIGKHLAILEMKLLIVGIYSLYATSDDLETQVPRAQSHPSQRTTFRDIDWFHEAHGILAFKPLDIDSM